VFGGQLRNALKNLPLVDTSILPLSFTSILLYKTLQLFFDNRQMIEIEEERLAYIDHLIVDIKGQLREREFLENGKPRNFVMLQHVGFIKNPHSFLKTKSLQKGSL
jgi:hypothetical protein